MSLYARYDPEADIVLLRIEGDRSVSVVSEETDFGLRDVDPRDGRLVGLELWDANRRLPADVLALMASPGAAAA